jgi:hypothetical protein
MTATTDYCIKLRVADPAQAGAAVENLTFLDGIGPVEAADRNPHGDLIAYTCRGISPADAYRHAGQIAARLRHAGIDANIVNVSKRS